MGKRVAVLTDSNSGITQAQGKALGIRVLPMPFHPLPALMERRVGGLPGMVHRDAVVGAPECDPDDFGGRAVFENHFHS